MIITIKIITTCLFTVDWLSYRLRSAPIILIKNHGKRIKAQKLIKNIDVWLLYLIFIYLIIFVVCLCSNFISRHEEYFVK